MANYFNTCLQCGCNLDPGERCDCNERIEILKMLFNDSTTTDDDGQIRFKEIGYARQCV